ncbi:MAG: hypothetical protein AB199_03495 [Parcubacteria bacterium C7867-004]|nr:MAG: hypothetical protein AB199_03495 [Parcubacteria bacterium C7867-004]
MQVIATKLRPEQSFQVNNLTLEDRGKLVSAFVWLIQEDKKQNPELYQIKKAKND